MDKIIIVSLFAFITGFVSGYWVLWGNKVEPALNSCQQELPRDQFCVLVAVPDSELERSNE